jgi:serine/threonine-protein kinase
VPDHAKQFDRLKAALADRYRIERELGVGGMATVYLAEDLKHKRKVALKVLKPELAATIGSERFLREIQIAAKLHHPHILMLIDSGEADGLLYYVMPLAEGETLRERLNREKQLPLDDALQIAREVADALSYAHDHGVIHRDVKPENIMLESGHAVVTDFGIARAISEAGGDRLTETGIAVGTPAYMSPEQASGSGDLDQRSDVYALACVVYEMLAGEPPFTGPTAESVLRQHLTAEPPDVATIRSGVRPGVAGALRRGLAKTQADRYGTASHLAKALTDVASTGGRSWRRPALATAVVLAVAFGGWLASRVAIGPADAGGVPRLVVLPFANLGSPEDEYFADGMTEEITSKLAGISGLRVIARQTAIQYKGSAKSAREIAEALDVDYVLEGTVRTDRVSDGTGQMRITPQLIRASDESHLWADPSTVDLVPGEIFRIQAEVAERIAQSMNVALLEPEREELAVRPTESLEAYERFLKGNYYLGQRTASGFRTAVVEYEASSRADPAFIQPLARAGYTYAMLVGWGWEYEGLPADSLLARGLAAADRAISADPANSDAWMARGFLLTVANPLTYEGVTDALEQAIALNPQNAEAHHIYGWVLGVLGNARDAIPHFHRALALEPGRLITLSSLAELSMREHRFDEARRWADSALAVDPGYWFAYTWRARVQLQAGQIAEARRDAELALRLSGGEPVHALTAMAMAVARAGDSTAARGFVERALRIAKKSAAAPARFGAMALVGLDDDRAVRLLERIRPRGVLFRATLRMPEFDPIRDHPRFQALLAKYEN